MANAKTVKDGLAQTLGLGAGKGSGRGRLVLLVAIVGALIGLGLVVLAPAKKEAEAFVTRSIETGGLVVRVNATGTLEPTNEIELSSELSGIVRTVLVDDNATITKGEVLAILDTDKLEAQAAQSRATLAAAKARILEAEATLTETRRAYERIKALKARNVASVQELDASEATFRRAEAGLASAQADVGVAEADLKLRETDLSKAKILSPIDGIVLRRGVEPGQTVASSLQAPVLFTLAEDLKTMDLKVDVDEADVSLVAVGQAATFTVDAFPNRVFPAEIATIRFAPDAVEGVVTYETSLTVDNSELLLRPGMTASAEIVVRSIENAVLVPNEALRFRPPATQAKSSGGITALFTFRPPRSDRQRRVETTLPPGKRRIYVMENGEPKAVTVSVGLSDGRVTEILGDEVKPGDKIAVDVASQSGSRR